MTMDMFLKIEEAKGESKDDTHTDDIDVLAWSWGASQSGTMHMGGGGGGGKVSVQDVSVTKYIDKATPVLFQKVCNGKHFPKAELFVRKAGENPLEYLIITMEEVIITSVSTGGSGGEDKLTENVTLNFSKMKVKYSMQTPSGGDAGSSEPGWNIATNTAWG